MENVIMIAGKCRWLAGARFIFLLFFLNSCGDRHGDETRRNVFRYNEAANITTLDPAFARDQSIIWPVNQIFNGLVQLDEELRIKPCIAKSWEISSDGQEYRFHLRKDVLFHPDRVFHDKAERQVRAGDFIFSFSRIADPATASSGSWIFDCVARQNGNPAFSAIDDSTFVIRLSKPFPPFLSMLAMPYASVVPQKAIIRYGRYFRSHPVGTGPFLFKYWKEGVKLVLLKNPEYFEAENGSSLPFLDGVSISFLSDKQSAFLEFVKGRLDFISGLDPS